MCDCYYCYYRKRTQVVGLPNFETRKLRELEVQEKAKSSGDKCIAERRQWCFSSSDIIDLLLTQKSHTIHKTPSSVLGR
jgi:hypothetical protein